LSEAHDVGASQSRPSATPRALWPYFLNICLFECIRPASRPWSECVSLSSEMSKAASKGKGGKNRRRGKGGDSDEKRELVLKEEGQEYGQVLRMLGNGRLEAACFDGKMRLCHIRGKMRKRVWVNTGDIVLVTLRDFQDEKGDVVLKYSADEARQLKAMGEIPDTGKSSKYSFDSCVQPSSTKQPTRKTKKSARLCLRKSRHKDDLYHR